MSNMGIICQFVLRSYFAFAVLSRASFAAINDLADTTVVRGRDTTLICSNSQHTSGFAQWIDITDLSNHIPFASRSIGVLKDPPTFSKYMNFDLDTTVSTQLDLKISSAELEDEGTYACTLSPDTATATLTVEIEGAVPTITIDGDSSQNPIILRASEESVLRCTARGFRPTVSLEWYRNNVQMTTGVAQDAATPNGDGTFNTSGTLALTPTRQDNEAILECRTTGQVAAPVKTASLILNVQYVPVVSVGYTNGVITCSSDANPVAINHKIILNGTNVVKEFTTSQGSHPYTPADGCTVISCSVASTAGTGTASFPEAVCPDSFAAINDLVDTTVVRSRDTTLFCSNSEHTSGFALWSDVTDPSNPVPFASRSGGVLNDPPTYSKYGNFELDTTLSTQLDLKISSAELEDEGTYSCTVSPDTATATLTVEIEGAEPTITIDGDSSGNPIILRASEPSVLRCTARGFRPAVTLEWYKNSVQITTGVNPEAPTPNGDAFDTSGTLTLTPIRQDNEAILECRTTGQVVAPAKTASLTLNVQYVPVVSVGHTNEVITCSSDANPLVTNHKIILNGTVIVKEFTTSQGSHPFRPVDGCTVISCNATNSVGTGTATFPEEICPGYFEPTTNAPSKSPPKTKSPPAATDSTSGAVVGAVVGAFIAAIIICGLTIFCWMRKHRERQKPTRGQSTTGRDGKGYFKPDRQHHIELQRSGSNMVASSSKDDQPNAAVYESIPDSVATCLTTTSMYGNVGPDLSFSRDLVVIEKELGQGAFGRVLLGTALGIEEAGKRTRVAIKTLKDGADRQAKMELLSELKLMKTVGSHPNVVKLLGHCTESDPVYIIVEYLAKGDLKKVLLGYRDKDPGAGYSNISGLSKSRSRTLVKFARDVASGMAFLSSQQCVHRDLAARNVLVSDDLVCKVSDFGLARDVINTRIYQRESQGPLPMRWMALESLLDDVYTTESDVWSFGVLLWEIVTLGARPYPMMKAKKMVSQLQQGYRMPRPQHCKKELYAMMCRCWQKIPQDRPTFQSLHQQLNNMLLEDEDYIIFHKLDEGIYEVTMIEASNEKL